MRRLLATAVALLTLRALPVAAETAEQSTVNKDTSSTWLILVIGDGMQDGDLLSLPMKSMDQCEEQGAVWMSSNRTIKLDHFREYLGFECLEGR